MSFPFFRQRFTFRQPDGTELEVVGTGDQYRAVFETPDGHPVVQDPATRFWEFARLDGAGRGAPSGVRPKAGPPPDRGAVEAFAADPAGAGTPFARTAPFGRTSSRWEERRQDRRTRTLRRATEGPAAAPPATGTAGRIVGLCLPIEFPDVPAAVADAEIERFCNLPGYAGFGNNGSVRDYFLDVSGGRLDYGNLVLPRYRARRDREHYTNPGVGYTIRAIELIEEALAHHAAQGVDFSGLSADDAGFVYAVNAFYAGPTVNNWMEGLWPHQWHLDRPFRLAPGRRARDYQITNMGDALSLGTFCHETGHLVCDFPDLYDTKAPDSGGVGQACLMCQGGNADPLNPVQVGAYLKHAAGWADSVVPLTAGGTVTLRAGRNEFALHRKNDVEYFIVENRARRGRDAALPGEGLAVWHVDELGSNDHGEMTPSRHYECAVVQADGRNDLERLMSPGDPGDFFHAGGNARLSDTTTPNARWWNGGASGLDLREISAIGPAMRFRTG